MRILFLTKRVVSGRDVLGQRFGRMYELPVALHRLGHQVTAACLGYYPLPVPPDPADGVTWLWGYSGRLVIPGLLRWRGRLARLVDELRPDVVIGASDALHVILAHQLARRAGCRLVLDLYDNFEAFTLTRLPGVHAGFLRALKSADGVAVVSESLESRVAGQCAPSAPLTVVGNAVPAGFEARDGKLAARRKLGRPEPGRWIGVAGSLYRSRGLDTLYAAFRELRGGDPALRLALAGPVDRALGVPHGEQVDYFGSLPYDAVPDFLAALDVGVIPGVDDEFGRYCFPQKAFELLACGTPVVAAAVGEMARLFRDTPDLLYAPGDPADLQRALGAQLSGPIRPSLVVPRWPEQGSRLEKLLTAVTGRQAPARITSCRSGPGSRKAP